MNKLPHYETDREAVHRSDWKPSPGRRDSLRLVDGNVTARRRDRTLSGRARRLRHGRAAMSVSARARGAPYTRGVSTQKNDPRALALGVIVYLIWGFFPLYFSLLSPAGAVEVIVHRAVWGLFFCLLALTLTGSLGKVRAHRRQLVGVRVRGHERPHDGRGGRLFH